MICRLLRNIILTVSLAVGLTACTQGFFLNPANSVTAPNASANGTDKSRMTRSFNRRGAGATNQNPDGGANPLLTLGPTIETGNLWDSLRANFRLPTATNRPEVQAQINWLMRNQGYLDRTVRRAAPYMHLIFMESQSRNLPAELVLLPIMESAYNPFIRSNRGAVGLWQLMSATASSYGVKQDFWYDGRRDVYASTNAALDYLTYLQSYFGGDWLLAIAAYDAGEGRLQNAVRRNAAQGKSTLFWDLSLPLETRAYVPRLLALAAVIENPSKYHITLPVINDQPYLQQVDLGAPINLSQAAQMAGLSLLELKQLNPGYSRSTTSPNGPYRLLLPIDRIPLFKQRLAASPSLTKITWGRYKIQRGDTLASIADRYNTTVSELRQVNHLKGHATPIGKVIMIPTGSQTVTPEFEDLATGQKTKLTMDNVVDQAATTAENNAPTATAAATTASASTSNVVANMSSQTPIAQVATVTAAPIEATQAAAVDDQVDTDDDDTDTTPAYTPVSAQTKQTYIVKHGDTLASIARRFGVKVSDIQRWNKLKANVPLKLGAKLIIYSKTAPTRDVSSPHHIQKATNNTGLTKATSNKPAPVIKVASSTKAVVATKPASQSSSKVVRYVVKPGDTLNKIANHYNVKVASLQKWNNLASNSVVKPGQKLVIYTQ